MMIIIYGSQYGTTKTFAKLSSVNGKKIIIATVGLADPMDTENTNTIKSGMEKQLSKEVYKNASIMHLRGGIDYSHLNFKHKTMMAMLYKKAIGLPEEKTTAEVNAMIETYNQKVDFVDLKRLDEIVDIVCKIH